MKNQMNKTKEQLTIELEELRTKSKKQEDKLNASNQQLEAHNQQLQATEQQLKAANQQLTANNQQLIATEQQLRAANQQLTASEQKLRNIFENSTNMFYSHTVAHQLTYLSPQVEHILGYSVEEAMTKWTEFASDDPINEIGFKNTVKAIETGERQAVYELELVRKDGRKIIVEVRESPLVENGKTVAMVGSLVDITERKQAEERLKESDIRLRQVIDTVPHMIFAKDRDGRFIMANKAVADGRGTTPENMVGKTHPELLGATPEQYESYLTDDREVIDSGKLKFIPEEDYTHPAGHTVIMETTKIPFTSAGIPAVLGVSVDITERKRAEKALNESNENYQKVVSNITTVIWKADIGENGAFVNTYSSPVLDELMDLPAGTMKNDWDKYFSYIKPEYLERVNNAFGAAIKLPGKKIDCEYEVLKDNGQSAWFHSSGRCFEKNGKLHVFGSTIDITERKQAEEALKEAKERTETILHSIQSGVLVIDAETHSIVEANPAALTMVGADREEVVGRVCHQFICPRQQGNCPITDQGESFDNRETVLLKTDGGQMEILKTVVPITLEGREYLLEAFVDITERKQAEEKLKASEEKLSTILNSMPDLVMQINKDLKIIWANEATIKLNPEAVGQLCYKALPGRDDECPNCPIVKSLETGKIERGVVHQKSLTGVGESFWDDIGIPIKDSTGKITSIVKLAKNITAKIQSEKAIKESEEKYRLLADNSMDVIWKMNLKLVFTYTSPSVKNIFGFTVDEWVGTRLSQYTSTKDFFNMARKALNAIKHYKEYKHLTFNTVMLRKDGTEIPVEITAKLIFGKKGLPIGFQGTTRDITERKKAEEALKKRMKELEIFNDAAVDRELKIIEHRKEINELLKKLGEDEKYEIVT